jgi:tRNA(fMet)-specific endonuclease VapC
MLRYLLDTNIAIFVIRQRPPKAAAVFNRHAGRMALSAITLAELMHGAEKSSRPEANLAVVEDFCSRLEVLTYGPKAAQHYGQVRAALELVGTPSGVNDLHIAAHARSEGLVIVTNNRREFDRVPALLVEDWSL